MLKPRISLLSTAIGAVIASSSLHAGSFSLYTEGSTVAVGNYAAGIAAEAADASTAWYNPAGLTFLNSQQLVVSGVGVLPSSKISGTSTFNTLGFSPYIQSFSNVQSGKNALVPALHYAHPLGSRAAFGISVISPFGLSTEYANSSPVRYSATTSKLMTINVSPALAGKLTDHISIGGALDLQSATVQYSRVIGAPTLLQAGSTPLSPYLLDSVSKNKGHSFGVGFHAGILSAFNDNRTRVGLNYQSSITQSFNGSSQLTGRLADPIFRNPNAVFLSNHLSSNPIELPSVTTLSGYHDINQQWALLGSVVYTGWRSLKNIQLNQVAAFSPEIEQVLVNANSTQNYHNSWRFAVGANYHVNDKWLMRVGGGYDQTPTSNAFRDVRLPDPNRWALSIGTHYQVVPSVGIDAGYTYLFAANTPVINITEALGTTSNYHVNARGNVHAQLIGLQAVWTIDQPAPAAKK